MIDPKLVLAVNSDPPIVPEGEVIPDIEESIQNFQPMGIVYSVVFSPDGKILASGSSDETVHLWEVSTGKEIARMEGHSSFVSSVVFSPDGKMLASGSSDKTVRLWDASTGKLIASIACHSYVHTVTFSPDGKMLAFGLDDNTLRLLDVSTGKELACMVGHSYHVNSVTFSPDGRMLASGSYDRTVRLWNVSTGKSIARIEGHSYHVNSVTFSPDGRMLASGSYDRTVRLWDVSTKKSIASLEVDSCINSITFSSDGRMLASGSDDNTVRLWDISSGKEIARMTRHSSSVLSVAFSSDCRMLASGSADRSLQLWDVSTGKLIARKVGQPAFVNSVAFSPDGRTLASGSADKTLCLWDVSTGKKITHISGHSSQVNTVAFSPDGKTLASGSSDKTLRLWDVSTGKEISRMKNYFYSVNSVAFSPDGRILASSDRVVRLWDVSTRKEIARMAGHSSQINSIAFSPNGQMLASGSSDKYVRLWDVSTRKEILRMAAWRFSYYVLSVTFSPDGQMLASGLSNNTVRLWDVSTGKEITYMVAHSEVNSVAFSPDCRILACGSDDNAVHLWDVSTGKEITYMVAHSNVHSVAFSPDGHFLASGSFDNTVRLWDISTKQMHGLFVGGQKGNWLSCIDNRCLRSDDGTFLTQIDNTKINPIYPPHMPSNTKLSVSAPQSITLSDGNLTPFTLSIQNTGSDRIYWIDIVHQNPVSMVFFKPPTIKFLDAGQTKDITCSVSPAFVYQDPKDQYGNLHLKIQAPHVSPVLLDIPVHIQMPELAITNAKLQVQDEKMLLLLSLSSETIPITSSLEVKAYSSSHDFASQKLNEISSQPTDIAFVIPDTFTIDQQSKLSLKIYKSQHPVHEWHIPIQDIQMPLPAWFFYAWTSLLIVALLTALFYISIFFNAQVKQISKAPELLINEPIHSLASTVRKLKLTYSLQHILNTTGVSKNTLKHALDFNGSSFAARCQILCDRLQIKECSLIDEKMTIYKIKMPDSILLNINECFLVFPPAHQTGKEIYNAFINKTQLHIIISQGQAQADELAKECKDFKNWLVLPNQKELTRLLLDPAPLDALATIIATQMQIDRISPYKTSAGITNDAVFFGRTHILATIMQRNLSNYILIGARQIGKSSILKKIERKYRNHPVIQCFLIEANHMTDIAEPIANALQLPPQTSLNDSLAFMHQQAPEYQYLFLIDEADIFVMHEASTGYQTLHQFRNISEQSVCHFIMSGFWGLYKSVAFDYHSPIKNFAETLIIGELEKEACYDLATIPMAKMNISYESEDIIHEIIEKTGGRANLIAIICDRVLKELPNDSQRLIRRKNIEDVMDQEPFLADIDRGWKQMAQNESADKIGRVIVYATIGLESFTLKELPALLKQHGFQFKLEEIKQALLRLELAFILRRKKSTYVYCIPLFVEINKEDAPQFLEDEKFL
jgi:WD40 repeat protein